MNLHYEGTVETTVYGALRELIELIDRVVGRLEPILARMPVEIADAVLTGPGRPDASNLADCIKCRVSEEQQRGLDIDAALDSHLAMPHRARSAATPETLDRVIRDPRLMPPGIHVQSLRSREYGLLAPGMTAPIRVTTDAVYYEEISDSVELWSPGNPLFTAPEPPHYDSDSLRSTALLKDLLEG